MDEQSPPYPMVGLLFFPEASVLHLQAVRSLQFCFIETGTPQYAQMVDLRMKVLLGPIGIPRTYINPQKEAEDLLIGAYNAGQLVGCCILTGLSSIAVQLRQMAVDTSLQNQGVGTALLSFAEEKAREKGYKELVLHARDTVLCFYEKCGYQAIGGQFFEVGIAHHKMQKLIAPGS